MKAKDKNNSVVIQEEKPQRKYADPIDLAALHDQLMLAIASEQQAYEGLPLIYDLSKGECLPYDVVDPIIRDRKPNR